MTHTIEIVIGQFFDNQIKIWMLAPTESTRQCLELITIGNNKISIWNNFDQFWKMKIANVTSANIKHVVFAFSGWILGQGHD